MTPSPSTYISDLLQWAETHAGLGGWVGATGALLAILATWLVANGQMRRDRRARISERKQYVDLISDSITGLENILEPFLVIARSGNITHQPNFGQRSLTVKNAVAENDFVKIHVKDWPSVGTYRYFRAYWYNTNRALSIAYDLVKMPQPADPIDVQKHSNSIARYVKERDEALMLLRSALHTARSSTALY
jgi:hypothetical protein